MDKFIDLFNKDTFPYGSYIQLQGDLYVVYSPVWPVPLAKHEDPLTAVEEAKRKLEKMEDEPKD